MNNFDLRMHIYATQFPTIMIKQLWFVSPFSNYATTALLDLHLGICIRQLEQTNCELYLCGYVSISALDHSSIYIMCENNCNMRLRLNRTSCSITMIFIFLEKELRTPRYGYPSFQCIYLLLIIDYTLHCGSSS